MRIAILAAMAWTAVVVAVLLVTPSLTSAPPCAGMVEPAPGCDALTAAANDFVWLTQTRPMAILSAGGYVLIAVLTLAGRARR
jgi:hypothetical protein